MISTIVKCIRNITVEPTMVLYMMAFMITSVVEQAFFVDKACRVNHNFTKAICDNLTADENEEYNKVVTATTSEFHQWNDIGGHVGPIILALFMGAWSDRRGRKLPLVIGLIGKLYYSSMVIVNSLYYNWPVEYIIYTATLPMAFTGADVAIFAAAYSYIIDVSSTEDRTMRVTILEVCYLATIPTGTALGSYLFTKVFDRSFSIMFGINVSLLALSIIYSFIFLKWRTNENQRSILEADNVFVDFFDINHVSQTMKTLVKWRPKNRRTYLILLIIAMGLYSFQRDEKQNSYLYQQMVFKWEFGEISNFRTYLSALQDVGMILVIPLLSKFLGFRDTSIMIIGSICHSVARVFYANCYDKWLIYLGGGFAAFGPIVAPVLRSMVSKLVGSTERGKAFSLLSVTDNAIPLVSGIAYNQVFQATKYTNPSAFYYVTIGTQLTVLVIAFYIHCSSNDRQLNQQEDEETEVNEACLSS